MCKITKETVKKASERTRSLRSSYTRPSRQDSISLYIRYIVGEYRETLSMEQIRAAYGRAIEKTETKR